MAAATFDAVTLEELLAAREARAARQVAALRRFGTPLLSATTVMPGPVKDGWLPRRVMEIALQEIDALIRTSDWPLLSLNLSWPNTGPEAIYVLNVDAQVLKSTVIDLEEHHPIGRLWDLDVITTSGTTVSRVQLARPARRCLVCSQPARECGRSRRHSQTELIQTIRKLVDDVDLHGRT